jgi:hypothetical protein
VVQEAVQAADPEVESGVALAEVSAEVSAEVVR